MIWLFFYVYGSVRSPAATFIGRMSRIIGLIAKKYAERCGIKHNLNALSAFKAFQHAEKAICESNCKKVCLNACSYLNINNFAVFKIPFYE